MCCKMKKKKRCGKCVKIAPICKGRKEGGREARERGLQNRVTNTKSWLSMSKKKKKTQAAKEQGHKNDYSSFLF